MHILHEGQWAEGGDAAAEWDDPIGHDHLDLLQTAGDEVKENSS